jgi:hypothetical protein
LKSLCTYLHFPVCFTAACETRIASKTRASLCPNLPSPSLELA